MFAAALKLSRTRFQFMNITRSGGSLAEVTSLGATEESPMNFASLRLQSAYSSAHSLLQ